MSVLQGKRVDQEIVFLQVHLTKGNQQKWMDGHQVLLEQQNVKVDN